MEPFVCAEGAHVDLDAVDFNPVEAVNHLLGAGTNEIIHPTHS